MPVDYYPNKTADQLLVLLDKLQQRQIGGAITEVSAAGVRTVRMVTPGNSAVATEITRVLYSLFRKDPKTNDNPYADKIRRTRARYTAS